MMTREQFVPYLDKVASGLEAACYGNEWRAQHWIKSEALTTSDFPVAFQTVNNAVIQAKLPQVTTTWEKVAQKVTATNFKKQNRMRLAHDSTNLMDKNAGYPRIPGSLPRVPEETEYQTIGYSASASDYTTAKNGVRVSFSWEAFLNDEWNQIKQFPDDMVELATNTQEVEAWRQYYVPPVNGPSGPQGGGGFNPAIFTPASNLTVGATINPVLSFDSLNAAITKVKMPPPTPASNTPRINPLQKWALIVPAALESLANAIVGATQTKRTIDGIEFLTNSTIQNVEVVVVNWLPWLAASNSYVQSTGWALVPYGGVGIYSEVVNLAFLAGYETPELRIKADQGQALGGGALNPYSGSFDHDNIEIRLRNFVKGNVMDTSGVGIAWSKGTATGNSTA